MAVALDETAAASCSDILAEAEDIIISAGTFTETLIVAGQRNVGAAVERLIRGLGCQIVPVTEHDARQVAEAYT